MQLKDANILKIENYNYNINIHFPALSLYYCNFILTNFFFEFYDDFYKIHVFFN